MFVSFGQSKDAITTKEADKKEEGEKFLKAVDKMLKKKRLGISRGISK